MNGLRAQFTSYGAVPVGATTMYRLLQNGELVLLFPGGAREALKKRGEKYELIWCATTVARPQPGAALSRGAPTFM